MASAVIALFRFGVFGHSTIQVCLQNAYSRFRDWCKRNGKSTSITDFDLSTFKVTSCLACNHQSPAILLILYVLIYKLMPQPQTPLHPRLREFPHGMGKGHDCALLGSWLLEECEAVDETSIVAWSLSGFFTIYGVREGLGLPHSSKDRPYMQFFKLLRWTTQAMNIHFRVLYSAGIWIDGDAGRVAVETGFRMLEFWLVMA